MASRKIVAPEGTTAFAFVPSTPHDGFRSPPWSVVRQLSRRGPFRYSRVSAGELFQQSNDPVQVV